MVMCVFCVCACVCEREREKKRERERERDRERKKVVDASPYIESLLTERSPLRRSGEHRDLVVRKYCGQ